MSQSNRAGQQNSRLEYHLSQYSGKPEQSENPLKNQNINLVQKDLSLFSQNYNLKTSYENLLKSPESSSLSQSKARGQEWTPSEEQLLVDLHNSKGNRWVEIARELRRDDNSVKNRYHSRLRKTLRKINKCLSDHHISPRPLKNSLISKIVQTAEEIYSESYLQPFSPPKLAFILKNRILSLSSLGQEQLSQSQVQQVRTLISQIDVFTNELKTTKKDGAQVKQNDNKYKGKEIRSLLTENQRNKSQLPPPANSRRSLSFISQLEEEQEKIDEKEEGVNGSFSLPTSSAPVSPINYQGFYSFNGAMFPYSPFYFPFCHPSSFIFSGRHSSFTSYHNDEMNGGYSSMKTLGDSEQSSEIRPKQSLL